MTWGELIMVEDEKKVSFIDKLRDIEVKHKEISLQRDLLCKGLESTNISVGYAFKRIQQLRVEITKANETYAHYQQLAGWRSAMELNHKVEEYMIYVNNQFKEYEDHVLAMLEELSQLDFNEEAFSDQVKKLVQEHDGEALIGLRDYQMKAMTVPEKKDLFLQLFILHGGEAKIMDFKREVKKIE